jgi:hypothetical protein
MINEPVTFCNWRNVILGKGILPPCRDVYRTIFITTAALSFFQSLTALAVLAVLVRVLVSYRFLL